MQWLVCVPPQGDISHSFPAHTYLELQVSKTSWGEGARERIGDAFQLPARTRVSQCLQLGPGQRQLPQPPACTHCIQPRSDTCVTPAPMIHSCQSYFQTLAVPRELGFSLGPHSFLASSLPLGCPDEVAEWVSKGGSVSQYSPTASPSLPWWSPKAPSPSHPWEIVRSLPIPPAKGIKSNSSFFM